jgi:alkanesulfonate monooxygenase
MTKSSTGIQGEWPGRPVEVSWFAALCDDDYEYLGVPDPALQSSFEHCRNIALRAEAGGFDNILLPSGYELGIDPVAFAGGIAPLLRRIALLVAVRCGELWPPQLARQLATLDQMLAGRLTVNIISSDVPGAPLESEPRYARTLEVMQILRTLLEGKAVSHRGEHYRLELPPPRVRTVTGACPLLYFGGLSEPARRVAAEAADVYLMWPDRMETVRHLLADMRSRAAAFGRTLRFGYRVHVIVRETEALARGAARNLLARLDADTGAAIRQRSLDHASVGVRRQAEIREAADDDGFAEDGLWTGIGRARSGCGAALVGDPDQVLAKLRAYAELGIDAFILSGYPHATECDLFARHVLPRVRHARLATFAE